MAQPANYFTTYLHVTAPLCYCSLQCHFCLHQHCLIHAVCFDDFAGQRLSCSCLLVREAYSSSACLSGSQTLVNRIDSINLTQRLILCWKISASAPHALAPMEVGGRRTKHGTSRNIAFSPLQMRCLNQTTYVCEIIVSVAGCETHFTAVIQHAISAQQDHVFMSRRFY